MSNHNISFNTNVADTPRTRADFTYKIWPTVISITDTGFGSQAVTEDIKAVLRKIEYWHQGSIAAFKIMCQRRQRILARSSMGRQNRILFRSGGNRLSEKRRSLIKGAGLKLLRRTCSPSRLRI